MKWKYNAPKEDKALVMLNFIKEVKENTRCLKKGLIEAYKNNLKLIREVNEGVVKASNSVKDGGSSISKIIEIVKIISIGIHF